MTDEPIISLAEDTAELPTPVTCPIWRESGLDWEREQAAIRAEKKFYYGNERYMREILAREEHRPYLADVANAIQQKGIVPYDELDGLPSNEQMLKIWDSIPRLPSTHLISTAGPPNPIKAAWDRAVASERREYERGLQVNILNTDLSQFPLELLQLLKSLTEAAILSRVCEQPKKQE